MRNKDWATRERVRAYALALLSLNGVFFACIYDILEVLKLFYDVQREGTRMKVSFDLDDTLFVSPDEFETEAVPSFTYKWKYKERLRKGTIELFERLQDMDVEIWIYTTSFRSERYIRGLFRCYGLEVEHIVNGERHAKEVQGVRAEAMPSKYPSRYRIDLHIDDDVSVAQNGRVYGFKVFIVGQQDDEWLEKIISEVECIQRRTKLGRG